MLVQLQIAHIIHLILDGYMLRTVVSRLLAQDLLFLAMRGAQDIPASSRSSGLAAATS